MATRTARTAKVIPEKCKSCELCIVFCPTGAIKKSGRSNKKGFEYIEIDQELCTGCGICYTVCPDCCIIIIEND